MSDIHSKASAILERSGLIAELEKIGRSSFVGSYAMDAMSHNDIDIDVCNEAMNMNKLYALTRFVIATFSPIWYEAKEETDGTGKRVWFHGFEFIFEDEVWNFDIWFFDAETVNAAVERSAVIKSKLDASPELKCRVVAIKRELIRMGLYSFDKYTSMDVYNAVLENNVSNTEQFLSFYSGRA